MNTRLTLISVATLSLLSPLADAASITGAVGVTGQGDMTFRAGLEQAWDKSWWQTDTGHLSGYWDGAYTYWEGGDEASGAHSLSFSPVFIYEFSGWRYAPYIEVGVGVALFSKTDVGEQKLGSSFNFEDRIGVGLKLSDEQKVGIRAIHYSNAGIKQPNDGIESYSLFYTHSF
ncbi:acyloxyacyl hydrolase [Pseudomonas alkylphenolica]|uniref:Lipid A deacylase n=1 Tax=Pseudomonas alkylphenolica TaxID=237609 RepID=A0A077FGB3_9PSED|nr:acyloxyacyl hydrolase [Pseudomonas alkylphenolica]AIL62276.1 Lipid A 3-O-deacylase [Pseudomonas alkylphenolica]